MRTSSVFSAVTNEEGSLEMAVSSATSPSCSEGTEKKTWASTATPPVSSRRRPGITLTPE